MCPPAINYIELKNTAQKQGGRYEIYLVLSCLQKVLLHFSIVEFNLTTALYFCS